MAEYTVCVQYLPSSDEPKAETALTEELLYKILEYVTVDGAKVPGWDIHSETTDEVLSFFATYKMLTLEQNENYETMNECYLKE